MWKVSALKDGKPFAAEQAGFNVAPGQVADTVEEPLLKAVLFENEGYFSEAAIYYREMLAAAPEDERLIQRLSWLYWQSGLITAANEIKKRLKSQP